jgi:hypothetical protein
MTKQTEIHKKAILDRIANYIKENGTKLTDSFYYWNTYPVVIKDICVSYVVVNNGKIEFGDFPAIYDKDGEHLGDDTTIEKWKCRKSQDDLSALKADREYLENTFTGMKITDSKKLKKQWE